MIYVDRRKVKEPAILCTPNKGGLAELNNNLNLISKGNWKAVDFSVYSNPEVKSALIELFYGKCAYCESKCLHVYSGDVEHFRPKAEISDSNPTKPGYYWLAADWNNLLLSCRNCNQNLKHVVFGQNQKLTLGKMNQFPLANNHQHVQTHLNHPIEIEEEEKHRLLLNPCKDNPEEYLEYDESYATVKPKNTDSFKRSKAEKSITVYALQRMPLVQAREKVLIEILAQIQRVLEALNNFNNSLGGYDKTQTFLFDKILNRELIRLKKYTNEDEEYAGMARQIIYPFIKSF